MAASGAVEIPGRGNSAGLVSERAAVAAAGKVASHKERVAKADGPRRILTWHKNEYVPPADRR